MRLNLPIARDGRVVAGGLRGRRPGGGSPFGAGLSEEDDEPHDPSGKKRLKQLRGRVDAGQTKAGDALAARPSRASFHHPNLHCCSSRSPGGGGGRGDHAGHGRVGQDSILRQSWGHDAQSDLPPPIGQAAAARRGKGGRTWARAGGWTEHRMPGFAAPGQQGAAARLGELGQASRFSCYEIEAGSLAHEAAPGASWRSRCNGSRAQIGGYGRRTSRPVRGGGVLRWRSAPSTRCAPGMSSAACRREQLERRRSICRRRRPAARSSRPGSRGPEAVFAHAEVGTRGRPDPAPFRRAVHRDESTTRPPQ